MIPLETIQKAAEMIGGAVIRTPLVFSHTLSRMFNAHVCLKLENLQRTGSFKIRGAAYKVMMRKNDIGPGGLVAASAGNHAQGVALAAHDRGVPATIVMPEWASISKQEATRKYGGEVVLFGKNVDESLDKARELAREGRMFIHPFDDEDIMTGQGTIGLEIMRDMADADLLVVPVGGGGLISGIASSVKALSPRVRIVGVQAAACPSAREALKHGNPVAVDAGVSIADGIAVKQTGSIAFGHIQALVDDIVLVKEEEIASAILMLLERKKILAEGAGAVPLAALLNGSIRLPAGCRTVLLISGGNVDSPLLGRILQKGLVKNGRLMKIHLDIADIPGSLADLLDRIARLKANVLHIFHHREVRGLPIHMTRVTLDLETRSDGHIALIRRNIEEAGYLIRYDCDESTDNIHHEGRFFSSR